ncbi:MAG: COX15/CtaA family protein [Halobacteriota archaeon]
MTLVLVMLGVYTAATGSGLACSAQWPLCDNGLLPQTLPSFIEWFHRLVAMVTGFFILGTAGWAWRRGERRERLAATLAVVLLPLQISIGAVTVTLNGLLPGGYSPPTQAAHLLVALSIFTCLVLTTLFAAESTLRGRPLARARQALGAALLLLPFVVVFSRVGGLLAYGPAAQALFAGLSLALFATLVAATLWSSRSSARDIQSLTLFSLALVFVGVLLGRDLVFYSPTVRAVNGAVFLLAVGCVATAAYLGRRRASTGSGRPQRLSTDD